MRMRPEGVEPSLPTSQAGVLATRRRSPCLGPGRLELPSPPVKSGVLRPLQLQASKMVAEAGFEPTTSGV